jgi:signal peptidase I
MMPEGQKKSSWRDTFESLVVTVILAIFGTTFVVQAFKIPTGSMENTLLIGDHLLVNKFCFAYQPGTLRHLLPYRDIRRGDVLVFKFPGSEESQEPGEHFVKRDHRSVKFSVAIRLPAPWQKHLAIPNRLPA